MPLPRATAAQRGWRRPWPAATVRDVRRSGGRKNLKAGGGSVPGFEKRAGRIENARSFKMLRRANKSLIVFVSSLRFGSQNGQLHVRRNNALIESRRTTRHSQQTQQTNNTMKKALATLALISGVSFCSTLAADTKTPCITLTVPKDAPMTSVTKVLDSCKAANLNNVSLRTHLEGAKNPGIILSVSTDTPMASVTKVLEACRAAGLPSISLVTTPVKEPTK